jgi:hypothetical protein
MLQNHSGSGIAVENNRVIFLIARRRWSVCNRQNSYSPQNVPSNSKVAYFCKAINTPAVEISTRTKPGRTNAVHSRKTLTTPGLYVLLKVISSTIDLGSDRSIVAQWLEFFTEKLGENLAPARTVLFHPGLCKGLASPRETRCPLASETRVRRRPSA